jgi:hypothetical protein
MNVSIPLQAIDMQGDGYHLLVQVKIGRKACLAVLDTGASKTVFDHHTLTSSHKKIAVEATHQLSAGLGTLSMESYTAFIPELRLGRFKLTDFEVAVLDLSNINQAYAQLNHPQVIGVIGGDILMQYEAVIDYGKRLLKLKKK